MEKPFVTHTPTGAKIPVVFSNNGKSRYREDLVNRKAFTIGMLEKRWGFTLAECANMLQKYQIPAYLHQDRMEDNSNVNLAKSLESALFFEEYIYALEEKACLSKCKIKSRELISFLKKKEKKKK